MPSNNCVHCHVWVTPGRGFLLPLFSHSRMDKKTKKKVGLLRDRVQTLKRQLSGAKKQNDDPAEVTRLEKELASVEQEIQGLLEAK